MSIPSLSYYALIPHPDRRAILAEANGEGWTLPHLTVDDWDKINVQALSEHLRNTLSLAVTVLRRIVIERRPESDYFSAVLLMENHTPDYEPRSSIKWISKDEVDLLESSHLREAAQRWFADSGEHPPLRAPWAKPGWLAQTRLWIETQAKQAGYRITEPLRVQRNWSLTCMMVQPTDQGKLYIKATNSMFGPEAELTAQLGEWFPEYMPQVVTFDASQRLYMMREFAGANLGASRDAEMWIKTAAVYARMQRSCIDKVGRLTALGCWDRRPLSLIPYIDALVSDRAPLRIGETEDSITEEQFRQLQALAPRLKALCEEVDALDIPATLTHGDFHAGNIAIVDGSPLYFDWSDGSIGHPFMDLFSMMERCPNDVPELREQVSRAYLAEWEGIASRETLEQALALATPLSLLNQSISYRYIHHRTEESLRMETQDGAPHYVKLLLKAME